MPLPFFVLRGGHPTRSRDRVRHRPAGERVGPPNAARPLALLAISAPGLLGHLWPTPLLPVGVRLGLWCLGSAGHACASTDAPVSGARGRPASRAPSPGLTPRAVRASRSTQGRLRRACCASARPLRPGALGLERLGAGQPPGLPQRRPGGQPGPALVVFRLGQRLARNDAASARLPRRGGAATRCERTACYRPRRGRPRAALAAGPVASHARPPIGRPPRPPSVALLHRAAASLVRPGCSTTRGPAEGGRAQVARAAPRVKSFFPCQS